MSWNTHGINAKKILDHLLSKISKIKSLFNLIRLKMIKKPSVFQNTVDNEKIMDEFELKKSQMIHYIRIFQLK